MKLIFDNFDRYQEANCVKLRFEENLCYPGRFIRQILSIICSTCPGFVEKYPYVKDLILKKDYVYLEEPEFKIYMYLLKKYTL